MRKFIKYYILSLLFKKFSEITKIFGFELLLKLSSLRNFPSLFLLKIYSYSDFILIKFSLKSNLKVNINNLIDFKLKFWKYFL